MKKIKDTIDELKKIKGYDFNLLENNLLEKDTDDLKNNITDARHLLRNIIKKSRNEEDEAGKII